MRPYIPCRSFHYFYFKFLSRKEDIVVIGSSCIEISLKTFFFCNLSSECREKVRCRRTFKDDTSCLSLLTTINKQQEGRESRAKETLSILGWFNEKKIPALAWVSQRFNSDISTQGRGGVLEFFIHSLLILRRWKKSSDFWLSLIKNSNLHHSKNNTQCLHNTHLCCPHSVCHLIVCWWPVNVNEQH